MTGGGPSGIALDEARNRLYVLTRFDNAVKVVNLATKAQIASHTLNNPEPAHVVNGRRFLYDAQLTSSNGEASCSSCHIFGDKDELGWDLGNPDDVVTTNPGGASNDIRLGITAPLLRPEINGTGETNVFHSMKGPMTTQTLRGLELNGAMHWRGDRATGFFGTDTQDGPPFDADLAFRNFIVAFEGLNGREDIITAAQMQQFSDFALEIRLPPNPVRNLDNSLTSAQNRGKQFFFGCTGQDSNTTLPVLCINGRPIIDGASGHRSDGVPFLPELGFTCEGCHTTEPGNGFFGTDGRWSFEDLPQIAKIPHLRNLYTKVGMFGTPNVEEILAGDNGHKGDQIRGFGFLHDGSVDTIFRFYRGVVFDCALGNLVGFCGGDNQRRDAEQFMLAFDSDLPPVVGQQVTMTNTSRNDSNVNNRVNLLEARCRASYASAISGSGARECDLVAKAVVAGAGRPGASSQPGRTPGATREQRQHDPHDHLRARPREHCRPARHVDRGALRIGHAHRGRPPVGSKTRATPPSRFPVRLGGVERRRPGVGSGSGRARACAALALLGCQTPSSGAPPSTPEQRFSYALGARLGSDLRGSGHALDREQVLRGVEAGLDGSALLSEDEIAAELKRGVEARREREQAQRSEVALAAERDGREFLARNREREGSSSCRAASSTRCCGRAAARTGRRGLRHLQLPRHPDRRDRLRRHRRARQAPRTFRVTGAIDGFEEGLLRMPAGSRWKLYLPAELAYGERGYGPKIPPNSALIFEVELLEIGKASSSSPR